MQGALPEVNRPVEHLRVEIEAAFPQINGEVSELYAGRESRRNSMRNTISVTFDTASQGPLTPLGLPLVSQNGTILPDAVIRRYLRDGKLVVTPNAGEPPIIMTYIEPYANILADLDPRLGYWADNDEILYSRLPLVSSLTIPYAASLTTVMAPPIPASAGAQYAGPPDLLPEVIHAGISFLMGTVERPTTELA